MRKMVDSGFGGIRFNPKFFLFFFIAILEKIENDGIPVFAVIKKVFVVSNEILLGCLSRTNKSWI